MMFVTLALLAAMWFVALTTKGESHEQADTHRPMSYRRTRRRV